jgi:hypothetical protein
MAQHSDKNGNAEYSYQKPSCEYFLGVAEKYAKVYVPKTSDLLMCTQLYGVENDNERYVYIKKQIAEWEAQNKQDQLAHQQILAKAKEVEMSVVNRAGAIQGYRTLMKKRL